MIDYKDFILKPRKTPGHFTKKFKGTCDACGVDRGYIDKSKANLLCRSCTRVNVHKNMSPEKKKRLSTSCTTFFTGRSPWNKGKTGVYSETLKKQWSEAHRLQSADYEYRKNMSCVKRNMSPETFKDFSTSEQFRERVRIQNSGLIKQCLELYNFTCDICAIRGGYLNAHHLYSFDKYQELRNNIYNLVALCKICHTKFHALYGRGDNTKEQYLEFKTNSQAAFKKTVYILTGAPASGKSWVGKHLKNFDVIDSDSIPRSNLSNIVANTAKPLILLTVGVSTFIKRNPQYAYQLVVIKEDQDVIESRISERGGNITNTIARRVRRMESLSKTCAFTGTANQVLAYLLSL